MSNAGEPRSRVARVRNPSRAPARDYGTKSLNFAFGSIPRDVRELTWQNGELKVMFEKVGRDNPPPGFQDFVKERIERMTVRLWRAAGR